jgi:uncharacterized protein
MIPNILLQAILLQYPLRPGGMHGVAHWARVLENGRRLAIENGARVDVVELFAVFHDSQRRNDHIDPEHGLCAAELAAQVLGKSFELDVEGFKLLWTACAYHTKGLVEGDITVQTCWDSDRLDLGRVWIKPNPKKLCTEAARSRNILVWADQRSHNQHTPGLVYEEWKIQM